MEQAIAWRAWDELGGFLANSVTVNGEQQTRQQYIENIAATVKVFPDYHWELRRAIVEGEWIAVHLLDTGTRTHPFLDAPGDGTYVSTTELDMYRLTDDVIHDVVGTVDNARLADSP